MIHIIIIFILIIYTRLVFRLGYIAALDKMNTILGNNQ